VTDERTYEVNGQTTHVLGILSPIRMGDRILGTLGVNIDLTEQKRSDMARARALDALRESEEKLRLAVQAAGIGIWSWGIDGEGAALNDELSAIYGIRPDRALHSLEEYFRTFVHPDDRARVRASLERGVESGSWQHEYRIVRADGATRWVLAFGKVLRSGGKNLGVGAILDVTERREREEHLRQAQKVEAIGQLTAGIAHNFNNMLMGIIPNLELAARRAPPEVAALLDSAQQSAHRAAELVRRLTTFAGRNRPKEKEPEVEGIAAIVERAVALCRTTFDRRIGLLTEVQGAPHIRGDAGQLQHAVLNLLINARDALEGTHEDHPRVTIAVDVIHAGAAELEGRGRDHVRVRVCDNGIGMDAEALAHLYEPFFTTKDPNKGTGLGLATTNAIVREHGGFMTCVSTRGRGTTFSVYIPNEPAPLEKEPPKLAKSPAPGTETILVVDDEPGIRSSLVRVLRDAGYTALAVASGEEALALLADARVTAELRLFVLDVSMPGMPSSVLRDRIRELVPRAKVLYFTGYVWDASDTGDLVLEKPVTTDRMLEAIRAVLDGA
jgi:PAS domain S-box-containing protein